MTAGLQTASWITSRIELMVDWRLSARWIFYINYQHSTINQNGCGGGSRAHGGRAYEARLNLILPAENLAGRLGAAPSKLSFGDSAARAGARPMFEISNRKSEIVDR